MVVDPEDDPTVHWEKGRAKHGLAEVVHKTNHIAIVVSDVGRSADFYSKAGAGARARALAHDRPAGRQAARPPARPPERGRRPHWRTPPQSA